MLNKIHHVGIAVRDIETAREHYEELTGLPATHSETSQKQGIQAVLFQVGDNLVELISPTSETSNLGDFLAGHGDGLHHLAYEVDDIEAEIARLKEDGFRIVDDEVKCDLFRWRIAFLYPEQCNGVLTELVERAYPLNDRGQRKHKRAGAEG